MLNWQVTTRRSRWPSTHCPVGYRTQRRISICLSRSVHSRSILCRPSPLLIGFRSSALISASWVQTATCELPTLFTPWFTTWLLSMVTSSLPFLGARTLTTRPDTCSPSTADIRRDSTAASTMSVSESSLNAVFVLCSMRGWRSSWRTRFICCSGVSRSTAN